jgi:hypothetical protein
MGLLNKTKLLELRKKSLLVEILKLKFGSQTQDVKLKIQKLQQSLDSILNGKHE